MNKLYKKIRHLSGRWKQEAEIWKPELIYLGASSGKTRLEQLLDTEDIIVHDELSDQIAELIRCRNPKIKWTEVSKEAAVAEFLNGKEAEAYGVWVYYPWSRRLVHLLDREEFTEVRTSRNEYKITKKERETLSRKKVGIIGLSVGQSVSVTMAMERGFGEIRLADFDTLELTNLNRIRTGAHQLGLSKVICVAREIMEIDPFLEIRCFSEGLNDENMDSFFLEGGKLDMLIDECDGLDMKVLARFKARELGIPVLMEASDRATVDVERFDLEPERPVLHGLIEDLNPETLKKLKTNEEKVPYMLAIVGLDTISTRAKSSMLEIGESISTWPQLASAVTLGGGITADVCRRIFLNQFSASGRYHIDLEELIGDRSTDYSVKKYPGPQPQGPKQEWTDLVRTFPGEKSLPDTLVEEIIKAAHHAPSGGNLQPWYWMHRGNRLFLFFQENLISSFLDADHAASYIALGASLENACLAAQKAGWHSRIQYFPDSSRKDWIASVELCKDSASATAHPRITELEDHLYGRHTNRNIEHSLPIGAEERSFLHRAAEGTTCGLKLFEPGEERQLLEECIASAERLRMLNKEGHRNYMEEIRWSKQEAEATGDGIDLATTDLTPSEEAGFRIARHRGALDLLKELGLGKGLEKLSRKATASAPLLGMLYVEERTALSMIKGGQALERVWIAANALSIGFQPQSPLSLLISRAESGKGLDAFEREELNSLVNKLYSLTPQNQHPLFIFRLFKGDKPVIKSLRRSLTHHFSIPE
jgi:molybdopterin/thiamine biosynthesis adenylyltransferase